MRILFSRNFAYAKFLENKVLAKISEFTVLVGSIKLKLLAIMGLIRRKPAFDVSDRVGLKPICSATEISKNIEVLHEATSSKLRC